MDPTVWILTPLAGLVLYALVWWLRGAPGGRVYFNLVVSLWLLLYFLITAGLGVYWVARMDLPVFRSSLSCGLCPVCAGGPPRPSPGAQTLESFPEKGAVPGVFWGARCHGTCSSPASRVELSEPSSPPPGGAAGGGPAFAGWDGAPVASTFQSSGGEGHGTTDGLLGV